MTLLAFVTLALACLVLMQVPAGASAPTPGTYDPPPRQRYVATLPGSAVPTGSLERSEPASNTDVHLPFAGKEPVFLELRRIQGEQEGLGGEPRNVAGDISPEDRRDAAAPNQPRCGGWRWEKSQSPAAATATEPVTDAPKPPLNSSRLLSDAQFLELRTAIKAVRGSNKLEDLASAERAAALALGHGETPATLAFLDLLRGSTRFPMVLHQDGTENDTQTDIHIHIRGVGLPTPTPASRCDPDFAFAVGRALRLHARELNRDLLPLLRAHAWRETRDRNRGYLPRDLLDALYGEGARTAEFGGQEISHLAEFSPRRFVRPPRVRIWTHCINGLARGLGHGRGSLYRGWNATLLPGLRGDAEFAAFGKEVGQGGVLVEQLGAMSVRPFTPRGGEVDVDVDEGGISDSDPG